MGLLHPWAGARADPLAAGAAPVRKLPPTGDRDRRAVAFTAPVPATVVHLVCSAGPISGGTRLSAGALQTVTLAVAGGNLGATPFSSPARATTCLVFAIGSTKMKDGNRNYLEYAARTSISANGVPQGSAIVSTTYALPL